MPSRKFSHLELSLICIQLQRVEKSDIVTELLVKFTFAYSDIRSMGLSNSYPIELSDSELSITEKILEIPKL